MFKILIVMLLATGCASKTYVAPVEDIKTRSKVAKGFHTVAKGDTVYSIAWRYNLSFKELARVNKLDKNYTIFPGQKLKLDLNQKKSSKRKPDKKQAKKTVLNVPQIQKSTPAISPKKTVAQASKKNTSTTKPGQGSKVVSTHRLKNKTKNAPVPQGNTKKTGPIKWRWPVRGTIVANFGGSRSLNKGIDISGKLGESVLAAADGHVVYAGSGLRGYGRLLIVKHSDKLLSAYAHNNALLVKEGQRVSAGQKIAKMGSTGTDRVKLHFEIRFDGDPVDPLKYLPK